MSNPLNWGLLAYNPKDVAMGDWRPFVYGGLASITAEIGTVHKSTTKISHVAMFFKMRRGEGDSSKKSLQHILNHENPNLGAEGDMEKSGGGATSW